MARVKYFTPRDVSLHNAPSDCWVSWLGSVYDLSSVTMSGAWDIYTSGYCTGVDGVELLLGHAGTDVSEWFDAETGDVRIMCYIWDSLTQLRRRVDPITNISSVYCAQGRLPDMPPTYPCSAYNTSGTSIDNNVLCVMLAQDLCLGGRTMS